MNALRRADSFSAAASPAKSRKRLARFVSFSGKKAQNQSTAPTGSIVTSTSTTSLPDLGKTRMAALEPPAMSRTPNQPKQKKSLGALVPGFDEEGRKGRKWKEWVGAKQASGVVKKVQEAWQGTADILANPARSIRRRDRGDESSIDEDDMDRASIASSAPSFVQNVPLPDSEATLPTSYLPLSYTNLHAYTLATLQNAPPSPHPLIHIVSEPYFPRTCNPRPLLPRPNNLRILMHRNHVLDKLEARSLTPAEDASIAPFATRDPAQPRPSFGGGGERERIIESEPGSSYGLTRWLARPRFQQRAGVWIQGEDGLQLQTIGDNGRELGFSPAIRALGGFKDAAEAVSHIPENKRDSTEKALLRLSRRLSFELDEMPPVPQSPPNPRPLRTMPSIPSMTLPPSVGSQVPTSPLQTEDLAPLQSGNYVLSSETSSPDILTPSSPLHPVSLPGSMSPRDNMTLAEDLPTSFEAESSQTPATPNIQPTLTFAQQQATPPAEIPTGVEERSTPTSKSPVETASPKSSASSPRRIVLRKRSVDSDLARPPHSIHHNLAQASRFWPSLGPPRSPPSSVLSSLRGGDTSSIESDVMSTLASPVNTSPTKSPHTHNTIGPNGQENSTQDSPSSPSRAEFHTVSSVLGSSPQAPSASRRPAAHSRSSTLNERHEWLASLRNRHHEESLPSSQPQPRTLHRSASTTRIRHIDTLRPTPRTSTFSPHSSSRWTENEWRERVRVLGTLPLPSSTSSFTIPGGRLKEPTSYLAPSIYSSRNY